MLRSDKISRMELKVLFSEDPAFVIRRADKFLSSEPALHNLILSILHSRVAQGDPGRYWRRQFGERDSFVRNSDVQAGIFQKLTR